jgi:capsid protein
VYKSSPVSGRQLETKDVERKTCCTLNSPAACIRPVARRFSGVLMRLSALKEYEDSELVAARIAAALGMYIKKVTARVMKMRRRQRTGIATC